MTTKEKAKELFNKFCYAIRTEETDSGYFTNVLYAKQCALIAVDEILKSEKLNYLFTKEQLSCMEFTSDDRWIHETFIEYWEGVKHELEKL